MVKTTSIAILIILSIGIQFTIVYADENPFSCKTIKQLFIEIDEIVSAYQIVGDGIKVLKRAKNFDSGSISLLGTYFKDGAKGFPINPKISLCLKYYSFESGNALAAWALAQKFSEIGNYNLATKYYGIVFGFAYCQNADLIKSGIHNALEPDINMSHFAFSQVDSFIKNGKIPKELAIQIFTLGMKKGASFYRPFRIPGK
jgi:hypothetical protein